MVWKALVVLVVLVVSIVSVVFVFLVISVIMAPKRKSKPPAKLAAKRKLESDKNIDIEEVTLAKRRKSFIITPESPELARPALFLHLSALPAHPYRSPSNVLAALSSPVCKIINCQEVCKNAYRQEQPALSLCAPIEEFWDAYGDSHFFTTVNISANKDEYKIASRYFSYQLNFIIWRISSNKAEHLFLCFEAFFMRQPGNDNMKTRCLLAFLREAKYTNKVMYSRFKYYACKSAALPIAAKYKSAINATK